MCPVVLCRVQLCRLAFFLFLLSFFSFSALCIQARYCILVVSCSPDDYLLVGLLDHLALEGDATVAHPVLGFGALAIPVAASTSIDVKRKRGGAKGMQVCQPTNVIQMLFILKPKGGGVGGVKRGMFQKKYAFIIPVIPTI